MSNRGDDDGRGLKIIKLEVSFATSLPDSFGSLLSYRTPSSNTA